MNVFLIPGNPPARRFYEEWGEELIRDFGFKTYRVSRYPTFSYHEDSGKYLSRVADFHKGEFIKYSEACSGQPIALAGHSIGAWMALKVLERAGQKVDLCFLLQPFLFPPTFRGRAVLELAHHLGRFPQLSRLLRQARPALARVFPELRSISDDELQCAQQLAFHERTVFLKSETSFCFNPESWKKNVHMIYSPADIWCHDRAVKTLKTWVESDECPVSHGFVTSPAERAKLSTLLCARWETRAGAFANEKMGSEVLIPEHFNAKS